jgi:hypothetical protein
MRQAKLNVIYPELGAEAFNGIESLQYLFLRSEFAAVGFGLFVYGIAGAK